MTAWKMSISTNVETRYESCRRVLKARGQGHVLRWWDELLPAERERLLIDIESIPWDVLDAVVPTHVLTAPNVSAHADLQPARVYPAHPKPEQNIEYTEARKRGIELIQQGKVTAFTVAGGQGTRLGIDGPKGMVAVTPVKGKSLFQLFAEMILAARRRYGAPIPWYIMTSPANHAATVEYLSGHSFFGLPRGDVVLFSQGMLPAFDFAGRLLLDAKHGLALAPDGHGGSLKALARSGALADMRRRGITLISYFQVDNPMVQPFDPLFIGLHAGTCSEMSTKVTRKADDLEKVGNVCLEGGRLKVIEYSELPEALARARNPDGTRQFDAGNLAIHLLDVEFVDRVVGRSFQLPFRRAEKTVSFIDDRGDRVRPEKPNAIKLETFVFDVLPLAANPLILEVDRSEEFSPVKNATGEDSLETSHRDQVRRACRWLEQAGVPVPLRSDGEPDATVEISPLFALNAEELKTARERIPPIHRGVAVYIQSASPNPSPSVGERVG